jgi:hypothetical protein
MKSIYLLLIVSIFFAFHVAAVSDSDESGSGTQTKIDCEEGNERNCTVGYCCAHMYYSLNHDAQNYVDQYMCYNRTIIELEYPDEIYKSGNYGGFIYCAYGEWIKASFMSMALLLLGTVVTL